MSEIKTWIEKMPLERVWAVARCKTLSGTPAVDDWPAPEEGESK